MKRFEIAALLVTGVVVGCMAGAPRPNAGGHETSPRAARSAGDESGAGSFGGAAALPAAPLILDRADLAIGTTVEFHRLPRPTEVQDANEQFLLRHVVVALAAWPRSDEDLSVFAALPPEADAIVIVPGYPPDRASLDAWEYSRGRIRMVLVVDGPPLSAGVFDDLNRMRHLERVVARMDHPSRAGFERLQRPLSFVKSVD
ncbi:MAG: hypothetical protein HYR73_06025 [Candidatus Eisenbacteria bacterium]|nr:hypothetical protein [Candidatus Eisenbacteria bacterium]